MLEDRDYMRQPEYDDSGWRPRFQPRWSWTVILLAAYAAMFLTELLVTRFFPDQAGVFNYLALSVPGIEHGCVWQLVTYQFMHAGVWHLALNCWAIYTFGRELEALLGGKKFLALMFSSGIVGGVFQILVALVWPQYFGGPVVGASACAFGLVAAFALIFPERELTMLIFFVIPVHLRAQTLLIISAVLAVAGIAFPMDNVANAAHLGGMAMGWFFVRKILQGDWSRLAGALRPAEREKLSPRRPTLEPLPKKEPADFVASEVDPILDKISAHGIQSLTPREREILETARTRIKRA
jgi:membrane associated rhomboid family serine protease